jgi:hypothetical protein
LAGEADGDLAAHPAAYLERSGHTLQSLGGDSQEIERQAATLIAWARENGHILPEHYTVGLIRQALTTAEHEFLDPR